VVGGADDSRSDTIPPLTMQRRLSTAAATKLALPTRHRRRQLPPICLDSQQLQDWTSELLSAPIGSLFQYDADADAWTTADATVQKTEIVLRGHAAQIEGTVWQRWSKTTPTTNQMTPPLTALLQRVTNEGLSYMKVRDARLTERHGVKGQEQVEDEEEENFDLDAKTAALMDQLIGQPERAIGSYLQDFAFPGPTVAMYDIVLDAMACSQHESGTKALERAMEYVDTVMARHVRDGSDEDNTNLHTLPTLLTLNAPIRLASLVDSTSNPQTCDYALETAVTCYDLLNHSQRLAPNSATYLYAIQTMLQHLPDSRIRRNIVRGWYATACNDGVVDDALVELVDDDMPVLPKHSALHRTKRYHKRENVY